jgi:putative toxin-antitoxin system antitoxin component (TIGR02293 family)
MMSLVQTERRAAADVIDWAHSALALNYGEIGVALKTTERTVRRWRTCKFTPRGAARDRLETLRELRHLLTAVFGTEAAAAEWLHSSVPALRGRTPASLLRTGAIESVIELLATIESGAYV